VLQTSKDIPINRSFAVNESAASVDAQSPVRTHKNRAASFIQSSFGPSPRRGAKLKQCRVDESDDDYARCNVDDTIMEQWRLFLSDGFGFHGKPTMEFMGWRRLTPTELHSVLIRPISSSWGQVETMLSR
jgi:hypothetical protein